MVTRLLVIGLLGLGAALSGSDCAPKEPNRFESLGTVRLTIKEQAFELWVADDHEEQFRGLMFVTAEEMAPLPDGAKRGMLFVFEREGRRSFWMKNTIIPLDIAYLDSDGVVVSLYTMAPLDDRMGQYASRQPAQFVIEVNADVLGQLGVKEGDRIEIPTSVLNRIR
jgi:uncharacterized membrane protein (UPF0127 family)